MNSPARMPLLHHPYHHPRTTLVSPTSHPRVPPTFHACATYHQPVVNFVSPYHPRTTPYHPRTTLVPSTLVSPTNPSPRLAHMPPSYHPPHLHVCASPAYYHRTTPQARWSGSATCPLTTTQLPLPYHPYRPRTNPVGTVVRVDNLPAKCKKKQVANALVDFETIMYAWAWAWA